MGRESCEPKPTVLSCQPAAASCVAGGSRTAQAFCCRMSGAGTVCTQLKGSPLRRAQTPEDPHESFDENIHPVTPIDGVARMSATYDISCHGATPDGGIAIRLEHVRDPAAVHQQVQS